MTLLPFERLTVIGLGLIGGSLAMAAKAAFPDLWVRGVDTHPETLTYALKAGVVDKVCQTIPQDYSSGELVILATHLSTALKLLEDLTPFVFEKEVVVSDVGSCKRPICKLGGSLIPQQFIGAHPMAGRERSGIQTATSLLFSGKPYLLCPSASTPTPALQNLETFIQGIGAIPKQIEPETHDRYMAYVSHFPQLYALLLTNLLHGHEPGRLLAYHGGGIDDQLRLAASPYAMWKDVFHFNQDNLQAVLTEFQTLVEASKSVLNSPTLETWFQQSNQVHQVFHQLKQP